MEAEIKFERENTSGIAVVGSYLIDAERRLGVGVESDCGRLGLCDSCAVTVKSGSEFLTAPTKAETEILSEDRLAEGERLSCQVKIATEGEIVIVTQDRKDPRTQKQKVEDDFKKDFESLPLQSKVAKLVDLEAMTLNETLSFIMNSPYKIGGKVVEILSEFGFRKERPGSGTSTKTDHASAEASTETTDGDDIIESESAATDPVETPETAEPVEIAETTDDDVIDSVMTEAGKSDA